MSGRFSIATPESEGRIDISGMGYSRIYCQALTLGYTAVVPSDNRLTTTYDGLDPLTVVETLLKAFGNVVEPEHCFTCMLGCVLILEDPRLPWPKNIPVLRYFYPEVYDAVLTFLFHPRNSAEYDALAAYGTSCHCDKSTELMRTLHSIPGADTVDLDMLVHSALGFLRNPSQPALRAGNLYKSREHALKAARNGRRVPWPQSIHSLLPHGIDAFFRAFDALIQRDKTLNPHNFDFLGTVMDLVREASIPAFLAAPRLPGNLLRSGISRHILLLEDRGLNMPAERFLAQFKGIALTCQVIGAAHDRDLVRFNGLAKEQEGLDGIDFCSLLMQSLQHVYSQIDQPSPGITAEFDYMREMLAILGGRIHNALKLQWSPGRHHPEILKISLSCFVTNNDVGSLGYRAITQFAHSFRCWAASCPNTRSLEERKFSVCGGCRRVFYCSKECQKRAWKDDVAPHKVMCPKLAHAALALGLSAKPDPTFLPANMSFIFAQKGVDLADVAEIARQYEYLSSTHSSSPLA